MMNLQDFYQTGAFRMLEEGIFAKAFYKQLDMRTPQIHIGAPQTLADSLYMNWLIFNYTFATRPDDNKRLVIGQLGGSLIDDKTTGKEVLALSSEDIVRYENSCNFFSQHKGPIKVLEMLIGASADLDLGIFVDAKQPESEPRVKTIGYPNYIGWEFLPTSDQLLCFNGNYGLNPEEYISSQYIFLIPLNKPLFTALGPDASAESVKKGSAIKFYSKHYIPMSGNIAGVCIQYMPKKIVISPLASESEIKEHSTFLQQNNIHPTHSTIAFVGAHDSTGAVTKFNP